MLTVVVCVAVKLNDVPKNNKIKTFGCKMQNTEQPALQIFYQSLEESVIKVTTKLQGSATNQG